MTILLKSGCSVLNKKVNFHLLAFGNNFNLLIQKCHEIFEEFFQLSRHDILAYFDINTNRKCLSIWGLCIELKRFFLLYLSFSSLLKNENIIFIQHIVITVSPPPTPYKHYHLHNTSSFSLLRKQTENQA